MISKEVIKKALRNAVESRIYSRGLDYFQSGMVQGCAIEENKEKNIIIISGKIKGNRIYRVALEFDIDSEEFWSIECTCPYEFECKHAVALGLFYADSLEEKELRPFDKTEARKTLAKLGFSVDDLPESLIERLLMYRKSSHIPRTQKQATITKRFNPQDYFFTIHKYDNFTPRLHEKKYNYQQASINTLLKRNDLTTTQRELLTYLKEGGFLGRYDSPRPDPMKLFPLLAESGFPLYDTYSYSNKNPLTLEIHPKPLQAEIIYEPFVNMTDETQVRHDFFFRIPKTYWQPKGNPWYDSPFIVSESSLVREIEKENKLELHRVTPHLAKLFARLQPGFVDDLYSRTANWYQTRLTGDELANFDQLIREASTFLDLTTKPPPFTPQKAQTESKSAFLVDFNNTEKTLRVIPVIDYGIYKQDVSESVYMSRSYAGNKLKRRETFENPGTHIITVTDETINLAPIDEKQEIDFYRNLTKHADEFGFTKTLKCQRKGENKITEYLTTYWPLLRAYAEKQKIPIIYTKDALAGEQVVFRADFTADMQEYNDWLYFDVACYCGDEKITLDKLQRFISSGERFLRKDDGTLLEISNREELERLVRLLQGFHARENGGFEGKLHHASELEYVMTSSKHYNARRAKSFNEFISKIQEGKPVKEIKLSDTLSKILRPYQKEGIEWLYFLRSYRFAGILADDMGLGKTIQTLSILAMEKVSSQPSIVICPKTLLYNWKYEAEKFFPGLKVLIYDGAPEERKKYGDKLKKYDLIIVSYGMLKQDEKILSDSTIKFNYAVLDEAQFIKNHATKNAQIVKKINADYRLALTGTPLENSVSELWSIYDFLMPGFLGSFKHFAQNFHKPIMDGGDRKALEHLRSKVESFMLRRTKVEVLKELPPKIEQMSQCHLTDAQNILYQQILAKVRGDIFDAVKKKGFQSAQIHILAGLTKLRQVCNHPALLIKDKDFRKYESVKLDMCMELIDEVIESKRKVLIFSQFTKMLDIVSAVLSDRNISHLYLSGKTKDRQSLVDKFNIDPSVPVFLISLKAGGTGINLTAADTVIIFDPWWNPSVENQAIDRTHRIGQTKSVNVYRLLTTGTIEEKIQALKMKKQRLFDALIGESGNMFKKLTWEDVKELFAD